MTQVRTSSKTTQRTSPARRATSQVDCPECGRRMATPSTLRTHLERMHPAQRQSTVRYATNPRGRQAPVEAEPVYRPPVAYHQSRAVTLAITPPPVPPTPPAGLSTAGAPALERLRAWWRSARWR